VHNHQNICSTKFTQSDVFFLVQNTTEMCLLAGLVGTYGGCDNENAGPDNAIVNLPNELIFVFV